MNSDIKPDFEAIARVSWKGMIEDDESPDYEVGYVNGCEKVWRNHVEPLLSTVKRLQEESEQLTKWRKEEVELWSPLHHYFFKEDKLIKVGTSISKEALRRSKEYVRLQEENKLLKEACIEALKHHQGGHSEIGHKLSEAIKKSSELNKEEHGE